MSNSVFLAGAAGAAEVLVCPPATLLAQAAHILRFCRIALGAQDCHARASGAFTGDISAEMIKDAGGSYVFVGHSERRAGHDETDAVVRAKAEAALRAGLIAIICGGETSAERRSDRVVEVVSGQLQASLPSAETATAFVVAYEPV